MRWLSPTIGRYSAYTVLGFVGFAAGAVCAGVIAELIGLSLVERILAIALPPLAFVATVRFARRRAGYERIVFYECLIACETVTAVAALAIDAPVAKMMDVVTIGIGTFLVFGRLGCLKVACCYGRPAQRGVRYTRDHVLLGFPRVWQGRALFPLQLVESTISLVLTTVAIRLLATPGAAAAAYVSGYGVARFALEEYRGDRDRRYVLGLTEAQRMAMVTTVGAMALHLTWWSVVSAVLVVSAAMIVIFRRNHPKRRLLSARHFHELCALLEQTPIMQSATTSEALTTTRYELPDGRTDFVFSHPNLTTGDARQLALLFDAAAELVPGRTPHLVHVLIPARSS